MPLQIQYALLGAENVAAIIVAVALSDLLDGPRGRRVCSELLELCNPERAARLTHDPEPVAEAVAAWRDRFTDEQMARMVFDSLRESADSAHYWQDPDSQDVLLATVEARSALAPVAEFVTASESTAWWSTGMDPQSQVSVQLVLDGYEQFAEPCVTTAELQNWREATVGANDVMRRDRATGGEDLWAMTSGYWWTPPIFGGVVSSARSLDLRGPVGLWLVEDACGESRARTWPVVTAGDIRVFEVDGPSSWAELVGRYPLDVTFARGANWLHATGRDGAWLIPDWYALSADYDAVHLTVEGYLTTSGRVVPVDSTHATFIAGWEPDSSYWLTNVVTVGDAVDWTLLESDDTWSPR